MSAVQRAKERALFKRLIIAFHDLTESRQFLNRLLGLNSETPPAPSDDIQRHALMTALIVSYARSFSGNRKSADVLSELPQDFLSPLNDLETKLHRRMLQMRNQEFAHSDPLNSEVTVRVNMLPNGRPLAWPESRKLRDGLTHAELRVLNGIFAKLLTKLMAELQRIETVLAPGEEF